MTRIFKYDFGSLSLGTKTTTINNALVRILDFQEQYGHLVMWASVWDDVPPMEITVDVRWTGDVEPDKQYYKTIQGSDGLVYHIYI
jgi:hypothetical protein